MPLDEPKRETYIIIFLLIVLGNILIASIYTTAKYYEGANYVVQTYVKSLKEGDYKAIYHLLDLSSIGKEKTEEELEKYYKKIYQEQNKLIDVKILACQEQVYHLCYIYQEKQEEGILNIKRIKGKWQIKLPFDTSTVQIFGPEGCQIYLDEQCLESLGGGKYRKSNVLPGKYMLQVHFPDKTYKDYYKILEMPQDHLFVLPYKTGGVRLHSAPRLHVQLNDHVKVSSGQYTLFSDLLPGSYHIRVKAPGAYIESQEMNVEVKEQLQDCYLQPYTLSEKGNKVKNLFMDQFYEDYVQAIKTHDVSGIRKYIDGRKAKEVLKEFSSWYIDKKDILDVKFLKNYKDSYIDDQAKLHQIVEEVAILYNEEPVKEAVQTKIYRVGITWDTQIEILSKVWQIENRQILESVVAIQDENGRWIQY